MWTFMYILCVCFVYVHKVKYVRTLLILSRNKPVDLIIIVITWNPIIEEPWISTTVSIPDTYVLGGTKERD